MKKTLKIIGICIISLLFLFLCYAGYVFITYYRIEDNLEIEISNNKEELVEFETEYTISTYNIGFGAYEQNYSFFLDTGEMEDGTKTAGKHARGLSKENVSKNVQGAIDTIKALNTDFSLFQEVDTKGTRSYNVNQKEMIENSFGGYSSTFAYNYHSAFLFYPILEPIGKNDSGIITLSKYKAVSSVRRSLPLSDGLADIIDLDRCIMVNKYEISGGKYLVIINIHLSAYDEGGTVRLKQMEYLNSVLEAEKDNYVIVGGDFNQLLIETSFPSKQKRPAWAIEFFKEKLNSEYTIKAASNTGTCRGADIEYEKDTCYQVVIDGFLTNSKIDVISIENIDTEYMYSDHNPVKMTFILHE